MSDLTNIEKLKLEKFFQMGGGYVLDFSNRTFGEFIASSVGLSIYSTKYEDNGSSKANRFRMFWQKENNYIVGKLITEMIEYWKVDKISNSQDITKEEQSICNECERIGNRLLQETPVTAIEALQPNEDGRDFATLAKSIRESILKNEPENALDRLHTFATKYIRNLNRKHEITFTKETSLNALFGTYVKYLVANKLIDTEMTEKILRYSISILDAFNDVRNNKSFAHDNKLLNYHESILILNNISSLINFINFLEEPKISENQTINNNSNDLPF